MEQEFYAVVVGVFEPGEEGELLLPLVIQLFYSEEEAKEFHKQLREKPYSDLFESEELWKKNG